MRPQTPSGPPESTELVALRGRLAELRAEFVDLAFTLERRGRFDAADVALAASARVGEICEVFAPEAPPTQPSSNIACSRPR